MEKNVSLFAVDRDIGGRSFGNWIWRCGYILCFFVVGERL